MWTLALRSAAQAVSSSELQLSHLPGGGADGVARASAELSARLLRRLRQTPSGTRSLRRVARLLLKCVNQQVTSWTRRGEADKGVGWELVMCARAVLTCALEPPPSYDRLEACTGAAEACAGTAEACAGEAEACAGAAKRCAEAAETCAGAAEACAEAAEVCAGAAEACAEAAEACAGLVEACARAAETCAGAAEACAGAAEACDGVVGREVARVLRVARDAVLECRTDRERVVKKSKQWRRACEAALRALEAEAQRGSSAVAQLLATSARAAWEGYRAGFQVHRYNQADTQADRHAPMQTVNSS